MVPLRTNRGRLIPRFSKRPPSRLVANDLKVLAELCDEKFRLRLRKDLRNSHFVRSRISGAKLIKLTASFLSYTVKSDRVEQLQSQAKD